MSYLKLKANAELLQKSSAAIDQVLAMSPGTAIWKTKAFAPYAREGYIQNTDVHACISLIATAFKGIRIFPYTEDEEGNKREIKTGPLADLLTRPNPQQSAQQFQEAWITDLLYAGNSYVERTVGSSPLKAPLELYGQRPNEIEIVKGDRNNPIAGFRFIQLLNSNSTVTWPCDWIGKRGYVQRINHVKFYHPLDRFYGLSPIEAAARCIDQNNEAQAWNVAMLQNGCRPSGALIVEGNIGPDQREPVVRPTSGACFFSKAAARILSPSR